MLLCGAIFCDIPPENVKIVSNFYDFTLLILGCASWR